MQVLPPYAKSKKSEWYKGTANAIYQNIAFIERYHPDNVLILSGDHIYKMDYAAMLRYHEEQNADCTIAVRTVPLAEASRFGIMNTREDGSIFEFEEKPKHPKSTNASMGIYIFKWSVLRMFDPFFRAIGRTSARSGRLWEANMDPASPGKFRFYGQKPDLRQPQHLPPKIAQGDVQKRQQLHRRGLHGIRHDLVKNSVIFHRHLVGQRRGGVQRDAERCD